MNDTEKFVADKENVHEFFCILETRDQFNKLLRNEGL